jgi:hypothetical protein
MHDDSKGDEFFIGYAPPMPAGYARFVKRAVILLAALAVVWAAMLPMGHRPLRAGAFAFGSVERFTGTVAHLPYPALRLDNDSPDPWPLLVATGKHAARDLGGFDGQRVSLDGTRIQRGRHTMIQMEPDSIRPETGSASRAAPSLGKPRESVTLTGEIVDTKCFLGVMVPGAGKTHKDCASLCLRGGIPPAVYVEDARGESALLLLVDPSGQPITEATIRAAGERVTMTGTVGRRGGWLVLQTDPASWSPRPSVTVPDRTP